jgi:uncharacterized membrane protein
MKETHLRSLIKSVSWRIFGTFTTTMISYAVTHRLSLALWIGALEFFSKILIFYFHERIWSKIPYGWKTVPSS